ncbi:MAG: 4Fe-4S cluster-binding domain-containing protein [Ruminococcus sp.]|nr:4Fe-4S cluster-binding domain-containing protein [Ruminococcus sp.]
MICSLCPNKCSAFRDKNTAGGKCNIATVPRVARIAPHMWEEPPISGTKGSGAVFFSGCTMKCIYCQNSEISADNYGVDIDAHTLAQEYKRLEESGVHNIDLISATQFLPEILRSFEIYMPKIPIVYNCGGYERVETLKALEGIVDIYLPDFKYSDDALGLEYSQVENYCEMAEKAVEEMLRQTGRLTLDDEGIAQRGVLVRHLVLPNHTKNSIGVLNILKEKFGDDITLSLMGQYIPHGKALNHPKLSRKITKREYEKVLNHLIDLEIEGFAQELKAADESFIPLWNYKAE